MNQPEPGHAPARLGWHWVLMTTADAEDPARHLYSRVGWEVLGPGLRDGQVILGRQRA